MYKSILHIRLFIFFVVFWPLASVATTYPMPKPGNDIIGRIYKVQAEAGDTIGKLGLRYGVSAHEMMEANPGISLNTPLRHGQKLIVPAQFILPIYREGIVVDMAELRLYYFTPDGQYVMTFPVAMGRDEWRTPTFFTTVVSKETDPIWYVPASIRDYTLEHEGKLLPETIPPGPDNPLGPYALHLGKPGYLIHGNNSPTSIGKFVSSGCIRMRNEDITLLYSLVKVGTPVHIIHAPNKIGWFNGSLYLKSQIPVEEIDDPENSTAAIENLLQNMAQQKIASIDWDAVYQTMHQHNGVPYLIGHAEWQPVEANLELEPSVPIPDPYT